MAKRKTEIAGSEALANPDSAPVQAQPKIELPSVESPSISPATSEAAAEPATAEPLAATLPEETAHVAALEDVPRAPSILPRFPLRPRHKRHALLAASVALAALLGAVFGAATSGSFSRPATIDIAVEENRATQQSIASIATAQKSPAQSRRRKRPRQPRKRFRHSSRLRLFRRRVPRPPRKRHRRHVCRSWRIGRSVKRTTATFTCRVMATYTRSYPARHCRVSVRSNRSSGRMGAGWW